MDVLVSSTSPELSSPTPRVDQHAESVHPDLAVVVSADPDGPSADALARAIELDQLVLQYHPVVELSTGRVRGVEALVRWQHPERGLVLPPEFIPLAEESRLIVALGEWVLRTAARQASAWNSPGRPLDVAINLSPLQMVASGFADRVCAVLAEVGAPAERIILEVTESALMDRPDAVEALEQLRDAGVRLALDDFGTGYASLSYLRRFPIDIIKIDQSFVSGLGQHPDDDAIVASVVGLAHSTSKSLVAEGVETEDHVLRLRRLGVQSAQGFLWTRPLPAQQVEAWIHAFELRRPPPALSAPVRTPEQGVTAPHGLEAARIHELHATGASLHTIAAALNSEGMRTASGMRWHVSSVAKVAAPGQVRARV
ncbi:MAG: GGDEF/EAL-domain containing protein [Frankiales bacterium]|nr:GGDEF/EAL-domain containing protein [Frankiales bacterium]